MDEPILGSCIFVGKESIEYSSILNLWSIPKCTVYVITMLFGKFDKSSNKIALQSPTCFMENVKALYKKE